MTAPGVLLLADARLPSGGHGHSGGIEAAVCAGLVTTVADLAAFLRGRLRTGGAVAAGFAAAACLLAAARAPARWPGWDAALSARLPAASLRAASRAQGAALLRTVAGMWDTPALAALRELDRPHHPLVLGAATAAAGGDAGAAATLALHHLTGGACSAAVRLLGLDPLAVAGVQAGLAEPTARTATAARVVAATAVAAGDPNRLPADGAPLPDLLAAHHAQTEVTLFAS